jgi:hypothetical protein
MLKTGEILINSKKIEANKEGFKPPGFSGAGEIALFSGPGVRVLVYGNRY